MGQVVHELDGGFAEAGVYGGDLDDGAARGDEPVKALALGELGDGACCGIAGADAGEGFEVVADESEVELGPEGEEALLVDVDAGLEEALLEAEDEDAGVDKFFALDPGDDADDGVVK